MAERERVGKRPEPVGARGGVGRNANCVRGVQ